MIEHKQKLQQLATELLQLRNFEPLSKTDLKVWYEKARDIQAELRRPGGLASEVPDFLWHYLADADTRIKSKNYADLQNKMIDKLIFKLKFGVMPNSSDLDLDID